MTDAPAIVLVFTSSKGQKSLNLTQQSGDYIALLQRDRYCISAYTRSGKRMQLSKSQVDCIDVESGKDVRLDVMLTRQ